MSKRALLLSGGIDSTALAWGLRPDLALTIDYGQLAAKGEIQAASAVCKELGIGHRVIEVNCRCVGSGDMAGEESMECAPVSEWWPFRNQLILTLAAAASLQEGVTRLTIGIVSGDAAHADGGRPFVQAMNRVIQLQEGGIVLEAPAIAETTVSLCRRVNVPIDVLAWSHSCHVSDYACGRCRGCTKHRETMRELGHGEY